MITRRGLLLAASSTLLAMGSTTAFSAARAPWQQRVLQRERVLRLIRTASKEEATFCYWRPGQGWDRAGYVQACYLLRDVESRSWVQIDPLLLDALFVIQTWLAAKNKPSDLHILSGYRTPAHNSRLEKAAKNSMHMHGRAVDFTVPGLPVAGLAAMARIAAGGGVGLYQQSGFVHMDTGPSRHWQG